MSVLGWHKASRHEAAQSSASGAKGMAAAAATRADAGGSCCAGWCGKPKEQGGPICCTPCAAQVAHVLHKSHRRIAPAARPSKRTVQVAGGDAVRVGAQELGAVRAILQAGRRNGGSRVRREGVRVRWGEGGHRSTRWADTR